MVVRRAEARRMSSFGYHAEIGDVIQVRIDRPLPVSASVLAPS
jgi:hypothetical protein